MKIQSVHNKGYLPEHWQHELLDSFAVSAALSSASSVSYGRFLRSMDLTQIRKSSFDEKLKMTQFSLEVLEGSIFCSKLFEEDGRLLPCILAAIFIIDWECSMSSCISEEDSSVSSNLTDPETSQATSRTVLDGHSREQFDAKLMLGRRIHAFRHKINASMCRCLSSSNLSTLRSILVQTLRSAAFETNILTSDRVSSLCCEWVLDMLEVVCHDQTELQSMLDQLLMEDSSWPLWVAPLSEDKSRSAAIQFERMHIGIKKIIKLEELT